MRYAQAESIRITYESYRLTTGLADVTINIYGPAGTLLVTAGSMTELAQGIYYYDYTIPATNGTYVFYCDSASKSRILIDKFFVDTSVGGGASVSEIWNAKLNDYKNPSSMGKMQKHGGGLYNTIAKKIWSEKDKEILNNSLKNLNDVQKEIKNDMNVINKETNKKIRDGLSETQSYVALVDERIKKVGELNNNDTKRVVGLINENVEFSKVLDTKLEDKLTEVKTELVNINEVNSTLADKKEILNLEDKMNKFDEKISVLENRVSDFTLKSESKLLGEFKEVLNDIKKERNTRFQNTIEELNKKESEMGDKMRLELDFLNRLKEEKIKLGKQIIGLPFASYPNMAACIKDQMKKGYNKTQAGAVCATIHKKATGKYPSQMNTTYNPKDLSNEKLVDDWRIINYWYDMKKELRPSLELVGLMVFEEINKRVTEKKLNFEFKPLKNKELLDKLQATSTESPNVGKFGGRVFIKPKKRKKYKMEELWDFAGDSKLVLEKTFGGEDVEINEDGNILLAERDGKKYYVYDILQLDNKDVSKEPWYNRIQYLRKLTFAPDEKETVNLIITNEEKLEKGIKIMGDCRIRKYDGTSDDVVIL